MTIGESQAVEAEGAVEESQFSIPKMDCPSEEQQVRVALKEVSSIRHLAFDLPGRALVVRHLAGSADQVSERLQGLGLGAKLLQTRTVSDERTASQSSALEEAATLRTLLGINAAMFLVELVVGWLMESAGLLADSLDMFADAFVYGLALHAVGRSGRHQQRAARLSGYLQLLLAGGVLVEVGRRFVFGSEPKPIWMMAVAGLALVANVTCLVLVARHREGGAHMKASYIFSTNDVIANIGVILAGALVAWTGSRFPDLVVGAAAAVVVLSGAVRILRLPQTSPQDRGDVR